jgi:glyoxylase-like metal-dependent hydrolase (beta-lactamase superfamily II)
MTLRLYAFTCGELTGAYGGFLEGESGMLRVPVPAYLIDHPKGKALFDTGLNVALRQDAGRLLGARAKDWEIDFPASADIASRLKAIGVDPADIRYLINSHLHFDHCGGNALIPNAVVVVQRREWKAAQNEMARAANVYNPLDFDHGHEVMQIEGEHDLFGDGSAVLFPTYGHTPGHQSLRLKLESGEIVLAADCCYLKQTLDAMRLPPFAYKRELMIETLTRLRAMRDGGARIFYGHDPQFWKTVPQAPEAVV